MCDICRCYPCHPRCPNAPEPATVFTCARCNGEILEGEECIEIDGEQYCEECSYDAIAEYAAEMATSHHEEEDNVENPVQVGICAACNDPVMSDEEYYVYDGKYYHQECYFDIAADLFKNDIRSLVAEAEDDYPEFEYPDED